jgi:hypothetical protein
LPIFSKKKGLNQQETEQVKKWAACWAINDLATKEAFQDKLKERSFGDTAWLDATDAIMPSAKKLYRSYFLGIIGAKLYQVFYPNATALGKK